MPRLMRSMKFICLALLCLSTAACGWEPRTDWSLPVWSDDDQSIAVAQQSLETKHNVALYGTGGRTRYTGVQIHTAQPEGQEGFVAVGPMLDGQVQSLYHMRSAGYVLVGHALTNEGNETQDRTWIYTRIDLNTGQGRELDRRENVPSQLPCVEGSAFGADPGIIGVPSPDGGVIAMVVTEPDCASTQSTLRFLDAQSLRQMGPTYDLEREANLREPSQLAVAWTTQGTFLVRSNGFFFGGPATAYSPDAAPVALDNVGPDCFFPPTTSAQINAAGDYVEVNSSGQYRVTPGQNPGFGCQ